MIAEPVAPRARAVALLVDGENLPCALAPALLAAAARLGAVGIARVYGDARKLNGWADTPGFRLVHAHAGKNVTDILLAVEAMELACEGRIDALALATRDRDFAPLALALRTRGLPVLALTAGPAPAHLVAACTAHVALALPAPPAANPLPDPREAAIRKVLARPLTTVEFGNAMHVAGFTKPDGASRWATWLAEHAPYVRVTGTGADCRLSLA